MTDEQLLVLGMVAVQVEKDPKTGATVVRSVAPMSTETSAPPATTVFDDGRKSIHAVAGSGCQPSTEELGQILSVVDGVGMRVVLDEVPVTPNEAEYKMVHAEANRIPFGGMQCFPAQGMSKKNYMQFDSSRSPNSDAKLGIEVTCESMGAEDVNTMVVRDATGKEVNMEDRNLEENPVTLVFLGYTNSTQEMQDMLTAERVIITEDGDEHMLGPQSTLHSGTDQEVGTEGEMQQNIPLKENDQTAQAQEDNADKESSSTHAKEEKSQSKRKTCQCCSVM
ncbi:paralemmin-2-like isoform X2 [Dunckerocampus dactyliophorus]|uniref:paralemmin-2-like isoform X2 n=1 Tax=Dunckerocampus dactyliophorus TaxID=161453 RepID=UPI00240519F4|nr:paralemmin-2-like isoform X2 [Dunckerocampus dactyliophorus]